MLNAAQATGATAASVLTTEKQAIFNLEIEIGTLFNASARQFLWLDLPPLQSTPAAGVLSPDMSNALAVASYTFRADWLAAIPQLKNAGAAVTGVDVYSAFYLALNYPAALGFTNITDTSAGKNVNPDQYLFWDNLHPTTRGHTLVAFSAYQALISPSSSIATSDFASSGMFNDNATPEPSSFVLMGLGFAGIAGLRTGGLRRGLARLVVKMGLTVITGLNNV